MAKIDLTSAEWLELVFQGKNKQYGAYQMRKGSDKRHNRSLIVVCVFTVLALILPKLIEMVKPKEQISVVDVTTLADLKEPEKKKDDIKKPIEVEPIKEQLKNSIKFVPPVIKKDEDVKEKDEIKQMDQLTESKLTISTIDITNGSDNGKLAEDVQTITEQPKEVEKIFETVEQNPQFPGGESELTAFLSKSIKYPPSALENKIEGRVIVQFVVGKDGKVSKVEIVRSVDKDLDNEAIRVVKTLPNFIPGKNNGVAVSCKFTLPVRFKFPE